jgi:hypothetical protein
LILGLAIIIIGAGLAGSMDSIASPTLSVEVLALAGAGEQGRAAAAQGLATPVGVAVTSRAGRHRRRPAGGGDRWATFAALMALGGIVVLVALVGGRISPGR